MTATLPLDVDDTTGCPIANICVGCGQPGDDLAVTTVGTVLGVLCLTLCDVCAAAGIVPVRTAPATAHAVATHLEHLSGDVSELATTTGGDR
ncbi:hypothetical protein [Pseudonocardia sp. ICBG601]|uniref:hypothetical protein n=1 Tax=Pseudonocardia sp. ICBG601 TaxID=2846759 RepID=UPI001CF6F0AA|nr:hypothetical protein [Pseudonocardia sp. ICBG601]